MWSFLTELNQKGITIILTTHYLEEAEQLCRNIGIIDHGTIVENTSMRKLLGKLAPTESPVLICGESGTGKELVARTLHRQSQRSEQPFIAINCGAIP
ncbi:sigma 54-interacting transcriptional regulator, partial [Klebsiella pneumoniae]|uniref:sigma 54-interacting transcriptional regulator n=1 Tax=Klebsiella pneumoniae TaxID=573 RepID=UPI0019342D8B